MIPGNSFDFPVIHGSSIVGAGYSFVTISDEAVEADSINLEVFDVIDFLAGEERTTWLPKNDSIGNYQVFTPSMMQKLSGYLGGGGNIYISGAHIATDVHNNGQDSIVASLLKYRWRTSNACRTGDFYFMDPSFGSFENTSHFNTGIDPEIYTVEGADALEPADTTAITLIRYRENNASAAVAFRGAYGVIAMGFPFESITDGLTRDQLMKKILTFLTEQKQHGED